MKQAHLFISGFVIGIGFRNWTKMLAKRAGIKGWVRNKYDKTDLFRSGGKVEAILQGDEKLLDAMIKKLKLGPPASRVDNVDVVWETSDELYSDFRILR